jgi:hypothetical protein
LISRNLLNLQRSQRDTVFHFLDGFELFKNETEARREYPYRPRLDAHWLEPASERFAEILAPKIQRLKDAAAPHCADGG